jgi:hypothetical protein
MPKGSILRFLRRLVEVSKKRVLFLALIALRDAPLSFSFNLLAFVGEGLLLALELLFILRSVPTTFCIVAIFF